MTSKGKPDFFREMDQELKSKSWEKVVNHIYNFWTLAINKLEFIGELHDTLLKTECCVKCRVNCNEKMPFYMNLILKLIRN